MFDKLMILDVGGYPIYYGNPVDAVSYFKRLVNHVNAEEAECVNCGNVNPEQIFNIIESKVLDEYGNITYTRKTKPAEWNVHYKELIENNIHSDKKHTEIPKSIFKIPNVFKQFKVFMTRDVKSKLTNTQYMMISFLEAPFLALILAFLVRYYNTDDETSKGYVFSKNSNMTAYMFMSVVVALFVGLTVSAEEIIRDRKIRKRESFLNLSLGSYLWSKIIIMFTLSAVQTLTFIIVGNMIMGIKGMYTDYWLILFSASCFANMLGLNISAAFNSAVTIYILIPFLIIPQLLLAGVVVKFDKLNPLVIKEGGVSVWGEAMASRWAFEALAVNQFKENSFGKNFYNADKTISVASYKKDFWITKVDNKRTKIDKILKEGKKASDERADIDMLRNGILTETMSNNGKVKCQVVNEITVEKYSDAVSAAVKDYLGELKNYYLTKGNNGRMLRDKIVHQMQDKLGGNSKYVELQENYENASLTRLVKNSDDFDGEPCLEKDGRFIQTTDPVYADPTESNLGGAHFFAPRKKFLGKYYPTFWFNICVIWFMSFTLMITLYFDVFKKILDFFGNIRLFKKKKEF
jgi:hypothetical protein